MLVYSQKGICPFCSEPIDINLIGKSKVVEIDYSLKVSNIKKDLKGEVTIEEVMDAIEFVCPALEILDTRYMAFK